MYIPTQKERYSKVAQITLLLCVMIPSGVVAWLGGMEDLLSCCVAFLWPLAQPLVYMGFAKAAALCLSALVQAVAFFWMARTQKLTARGKLTLAVTWGMSFALVLRILIAFELWRSVTGQ
ncbi:MAG: hypothetical protein IJB31_02755 [Akkermansia sp.]|nr:hypothetical protein [Akkermansia sp.]